ncbi:hypothetical protein B857_02771 [Solibacillus isronensis B3W22]|uniref:Lipoprotein n=2 Tax=Solibacillus TaxID=648800 RepID=F2F4V4_SOLSS|nr:MULTISPECIES: DUF6612 family protein [Solibacillus]AMO85571.1 hypothetical protein SOLI23_08235 [Solibacillus silvestris]EKB44470.1 hypothetical protein B857_02771 [Solibacillus isronensis B3W22]BAK16519.1 hypothetical protein SSIL_2096 [Solibacillus silvestris StLB046]
MKKQYLFAMSTLSIALVAGCGDTAEPVEGTDSEANLTLQQVYENAMQRQQNLKSVHAETTMDQVTSFVMEGQTMEITSNSNLAMDIQQKPMAMYSKGTVKMDMGDEKMDMPIEMYMTEEDGFYMLNGDTNEWLKMPEEQYEQLIAQTGAQADASEQLEQLEQFIDDFSFEQDDENYLLTLNIEGDEFKQFIVSQMGASLGESMEVNGEILENMTFEDSQYNIVVAKDTFDIKEMDMDLKIITNVEGQETTIENDANIVYSKFDEVKEINIPNEVINEAKTQ